LKYQLFKLIDSNWIETEVIQAKSRRAAIASICPDKKNTSLYEEFKKSGTWKVRQVL